MYVCCMYVYLSLYRKNLKMIDLTVICPTFSQRVISWLKTLTGRSRSTPCRPRRPPANSARAEGSQSASPRPSTHRGNMRRPSTFSTTCRHRSNRRTPTAGCRHGGERTGSIRRGAALLMWQWLARDFRCCRMGHAHENCKPCMTEICLHI